MKPSEILKGVLALFQDAKHWAQGYYAFADRASNHRIKPGQGKTISDNRVPAHSDVAVCWCLLGGIQKVNGGDNYATEQVLERAIGRVSVADWNDTPGRTVKEVRAALKKAITLALDEEAQAA